MGRWLFFLVQVYLCFLTFSLILPLFIFNSKSRSGAGSEIVIFGLEKKEEGSREWVLFLAFSE